MVRYTSKPLPKLDQTKPDPENPIQNVSVKTVPDYWYEDLVYLYGVDLFNHCFFWQAHEVWEKKWIFYKQFHPEVAHWMQGLIQISASFLQHKQDQPFESNLRKGLQHLEKYVAYETVLGIDPTDWITILNIWQAHPDQIPGYPQLTLKPFSESISS